MNTSLSTILNTKIIAISRGLYGDTLIKAARALYDGGIRVFEVAFEYNAGVVQTTDCVVRLYDSLPTDAVIGVGTVLTHQQLGAAAAVGAGFIISPNVDASIIAETKSLGLVSIPGATTPTEVFSAYKAGADIVKLFPAGMLGVEYFKAVKSPLNFIPIAAVAGVEPQNIRLFSKAGAVAFGISSGLFKSDCIAKGDYIQLTDLARKYLEALND